MFSKLSLLLRTLPAYARNARIRIGRGLDHAQIG